MFSQDEQELIRKEYAHIDNYYFNSAYFGPSPYRAKQKVSNALAKELDPSFYPYNAWMGIPDRIRRQIATLLNCSEDNITHSTSTSDIIQWVANGLEMKDDEVAVAINGDYPSNVLPWMLAAKQRGINFQLIDLDFPDIDSLKKALPPKTRALSISYVAFDTGRKIDLLELGKLCRERKIVLVIDATQALGGIQITPEELDYIDVLACSSYKWMLGPYGHAFGFIADRTMQWIAPTMAAWTKSPNSKNANDLLKYTIDMLPGARKYDRGQAPNMLINAALEAGLELLNTIKLEKIQEHNSEIRNYFLENFPKKKFDLITPKDFMGNILALKLKSGDPLALENELKHNQIDVSVREGKVRLSFHLFNTKTQVEKLIKALS